VWIFERDVLAPVGIRHSFRGGVFRFLHPLLCRWMRSLPQPPLLPRVDQEAGLGFILFLGFPPEKCINPPILFLDHCL